MTTIAHVSTTDTISANTFNQIYDVVSGVIRGQYAWPGAVSMPVIQGNTITLQDWQNLLTDILHCRIHQTGVLPTLPLDLLTPMANHPLTAAWVNYVVDLALLVQQDALKVAVSQLGTISRATSRRTSSWTTGMIHSVDLGWYSLYPAESPDQARAFFNLGGEISATLSWANNTSNSTANQKWISLIESAATALKSLTYQLTTYTAQTPDTPAVHVLAVDSQNSNNSIVLTWTKVSAANVRTTITLNTTGDPVDLDIVSTVVYRYSQAVGPAPFGVPASYPYIHTLWDLETGAQEGVPTLSARVLVVTPQPLVPWTTSASRPAGQEISLTNYGTVPLSISGISYTKNGNVTVTPTYSWSTAFPVTLAAHETRTMTLTYSASTPGTYNNSFTIFSNNDLGPVTVPTQLVITAAVFDFFLSPTTLATAVNTLSAVDQQFLIVTRGGDYTAYTATLGASPGFSIISTPLSGPMIRFDPAQVMAGTHTVVLTVATNAQVRTASLTYTLTKPSAYNLGSWISPLSQYNGVVGLSYDSIDRVRWLTVGVGAGADHGLNLVDGGDAQISVSNLGALADSKPAQGIVLYPALLQSGASAFMHTYGVWIRSQSSLPTGVEVTRSYAFTVDRTATYNWEFSVDTFGYFNIDGILLGDLRDQGVDPDNWASSITGTVDLSLGSHTVTFHATTINTSVGGVAINLSDSSTNQSVWNTLVPVRQAPPYLYWAEVYRIPLTQGAHTYQSRDYCTKDTGAVDGTRYGDYFGVAGGQTDRSIVAVTDDGSGNLAIKINNRTSSATSTELNTTIANIPYLVYYYSTIETRYSQLETPQGDGTQTHQFLGFNATGNVQTSLVTYPGYGTIRTGGGGGCVDPKTSIMISPTESMPAGHLDIDDTVYTVHEHTGIWGDYEIIHMSWINQPRLLIELSNNSSITVSTTHKFRTATGSWISAEQLTVGDNIQGATSLIQVVSITTAGSGPVIKFEIADAHTYVAAGLISHNKNNPVDDTITNYV